jgi:hypothetical protein
MKKITIITILTICAISSIIYAIMDHKANCINMNNIAEVTTNNDGGFFIITIDGNEYYFEN